MNFRAILGAVTFATFAATAASAGVVTFTSLSAFQAVSTISNTEDFESFDQGYLSNPFTTHGIKFTQLAGGHPNVIPYISNPGNLGNPYEPTTKTLDGNGDENFLIQLADNSTFTAFGFNVVTNVFGAPVVSLFDSGNSLIGSYTLTQDPNTFGFFGITSTIPIASVTFIVDRGWVQNTALDNIQIGAAGTETPEPAMGATAGLALVALAGMARRSRRA